MNKKVSSSDSAAIRRPKGRHIAVYLPSLAGGGAERVAVILANALSGLGCRVDLVLACAEGPYRGDLDPAVRVVDLGASRVLFSLPALAAYLRRERPAALLGVMAHANVAAALARILSGTSIRLVLRQQTVLRIPGIPRKERILQVAMRWAYRNADAVVAVSNGIATDLIQILALPPTKVRTIHNPVITDSLYAMAAASLPHPWLMLGEPPVIITAGRLQEEKDFPTLIHAFKKVREAFQCRLVILGEGGQRELLEELTLQLGIKDNVLLPGFQVNPFAWISRAALFVLSSRWEGLPGVLIQAMALGVPVVSTDCHSGPREILQDGRWGRLVPVGDVDALASAMRQTLEDDSHPAVTVRANDFSSTQSVQRYFSILCPSD